MKLRLIIFSIIAFILDITSVSFASASDLTNKLKGKILLQVESSGEAWYVYPDDEKRYYLGRPEDAFEVMRKLGLGAKHEFIVGYNKFPKNVWGKILLDVEQNGEAYYIYPNDGKKYFLGRPSDAFKIMREKGFGISNNDLDKIEISYISKSEKNNFEKTITNNKKITDFLSGIPEVYCFGSDTIEGSGSLWNINGEKYLLTNKHVIMTEKCNITVQNPSNDDFGVGMYSLDMDSESSWNDYTDVAAIKINYLEGSKSWSSKIENLNFSISELANCSDEMPLNTKVLIAGWPMYSKASVQVEDYNSTQASLTITEGIISALDSSVRSPVGKLPHSNYYVSAKIDSGNSGGMAFAETDSGLCVLGIPTWVSVGNYESIGMVQNINNVFYKE